MFTEEEAIQIVGAHVRLMTYRNGRVTAIPPTISKCGEAVDDIEALVERIINDKDRSEFWDNEMKGWATHYPWEVTYYPEGNKWDVSFVTEIMGFGTVVGNEHYRLRNLNLLTYTLYERTRVVESHNDLC